MLGFLSFENMIIGRIKRVSFFWLLEPKNWKIQKYSFQFSHKKDKIGMWVVFVDFWRENSNSRASNVSLWTGQIKRSHSIHILSIKSNAQNPEFIIKLSFCEALWSFPCTLIRYSRVFSRWGKLWLLSPNRK